MISIGLVEALGEKLKMKKCFIITPIGEEGSAKRRHIDGVINAAIKPVLTKTYEVIVPHEISISGSINKDIISNIYNDELVIANLTELNPNVMYELAFRHSLRKPVITIMENGGQLPFDIGDFRTIFYTNDFQGLLDLKENLRKRVENIENNLSKVDNPIYTALDGIETEKIISAQTNKSDDAFKYIIKRLDKIENKTDTITYINNTNLVGASKINNERLDYNRDEVIMMGNLIVLRYNDYGHNNIKLNKDECTNILNGIKADAKKLLQSYIFMAINKNDEKINHLFDQLNIISSS